MSSSEVLNPQVAIGSIDYMYSNPLDLPYLAFKFPPTQDMIGNRGRSDHEANEAVQRGREIEGRFFESYFVHTKDPQLLWVAQVHGGYHPAPSVEYYVVDKPSKPERVGQRGMDYACNLGFSTDWYYRSGYAVERPEFGRVKAPYSLLLTDDFEGLRQDYGDQPGLRLLLAGIRKIESEQPGRKEAVLGSRALAGTFFNLERADRPNDVIFVTQVLNADRPRPELEYMMVTDGIGLQGYMTSDFMDHLGLSETSGSTHGLERKKAKPLPEWGKIDIEHPTITTEDLPALEERYYGTELDAPLRLLAGAVRTYASKRNQRSGA